MKTDAGTGWERSKRMHFDEITENYDLIRPEYPSELFSDVLKYAKCRHTACAEHKHSGSRKGKFALEIGAGTGKATAPFLNAGYDVTAVEIGANMTRFLLEKFKHNPNFRVIQSAFEDAALEENSYDLVYVASAFHWVDAEVGCPKAYRLLKSGGVFALFRYCAVPAYGGALYEEIQAAYEKHYYDYFHAEERPVLKTNQDYWKPSELIKSYGFGTLESYGFRAIFTKLYNGSQTFSADEYIMWLDTTSNHRSLPEENRAALFAGIRDAIVRYGGQHTVEYVFQLYMGRK